MGVAAFPAYTSRYQHNLRCDLNGKSCPVTSDPMQPFSPSHEAPAAVVVALWSTSHRFRPATVAAGPHAPTSNWACGRFPSGKVPFSSLDLALPCSACALLLRCCFSVSRPRKNKGAMAQAQSQLK